MIAAIVVVTVPLLASGGVRCRTFDVDCPRTASAVPEPGRTRIRLTAEEAAVQGSYAALGDSYSSGEGAYVLAADLDPRNRCHRTSQSYVHTVERTFVFPGGTRFWACSGARVEHLLKGKAGEPPQIDRADAGTSLVTLSIGGNDLGFTRVLAGCIVRLPWSPSCEHQDVELAARKPALRVALTGVVARLVERAPKARIILLGYPRLFAEERGESLDNLSITDQRWLNSKGSELNELIREVAQRADEGIVAAGGAGSVEFIDLYSAFTGHEVGSGVPFVNGLDVDLKALKVEIRSYHPTAVGYAALAENVVRQIRRGPDRDLNQWK
ncbi:SGNH/GDSL hydrolase family protein [Actinocorallia longicatena]|uniref:SGNH/GDSL hydrolase family protein n=2 Tax=Actinocorallia longicatena TaxID=111803 RepID=A0ABP6QN33_9ACTN